MKNLLPSWKLIVQFAFLGLLIGVISTPIKFALSLRPHTDNFPDDVPAIEVSNNYPIPGQIYFEASSFLQMDDLSTKNYAFAVDRVTNQIIMAKRFQTFGMKFERHDDVYSFYEYPIVTKWRYQYLQGWHGIPLLSLGNLVLLDSNFNYLETISDPRGIDTHDLIILPDGNRVYIVADYREMYQDSEILCLPDCKLWGQSIVEVTPEGETVFQWDVLDHYRRRDFIMDDIVRLGDTILYDVTHINSIDILDNQWLISVRHTDQIINVDRNTGDILWRLGKRGDFTFINDEWQGFEHQHSPVWLSDNRILIFDNGNARHATRAVEYELDYETMTATLVWEYWRGFSPNRGSVQRLDNGDTLINFVSQSPNILEVAPEGHIVYSISLPDTYASYQVQFVQE